MATLFYFDVPVISFTKMVGFEVGMLRAVVGEDDVLDLIRQLGRYNCAIANGVRGAILTNPERQHKGKPAHVACNTNSTFVNTFTDIPNKDSDFNNFKAFLQIQFRDSD